MTAEEFRRLALSFPGAVESSHMDHPDFRVGGKIFATLGYPDDEHGMVVLPTEIQAELVRARANVFMPAKGAWGKRGSTQVNLRAAKVTMLREAMTAAWERLAPKAQRPKK